MNHWFEIVDECIVLRLSFDQIATLAVALVVSLAIVAAIQVYCWTTKSFD